MLDFIRHNESPFLISLIQKGWLIFAALGIGSPRILLQDDLVDAFKRLKGERLIICPNHSSAKDAFVLFALSALVQERFAFLAGRDIFGKSQSFQEKWLQKLGCYSVTRGTADLHAFKESCDILLANEDKLVIFPEGEISYNNALLRPFHSGPELIAMSALHELRSKGSTATVFLLPIALNYRFSAPDMRKRLIKALEHVEKHFGIASSPGESLAKRMQSIYLQISEQAPERSINGRFQHLCETRITNVERQLQKDHSNEANAIRRIHLLMNDLSELRSQGNAENRLADKCYLELKRVIPFLGIAENNFDHEYSNEELADLLRPVLDEIQTGVQIGFPDLVEIASAEPIDVSTFLPESKQERKEKLQSLTSALKGRLEDRLIRLKYPNRLPEKLPNCVA